MKVIYLLRLVTAEWALGLGVVGGFDDVYFLNSRPGKMEGTLQEQLASMWGPYGAAKKEGRLEHLKEEHVMYSNLADKGHQDLYNKHNSDIEIVPDMKGLPKPN